MTHREKSLTPWIDPKGNHDYTYLPASLYDAAVREGCDMKWFKRNEPIPMDPAVATIVAAGCYVTDTGLEKAYWRSKPKCRTNPEHDCVNRCAAGCYVVGMGLENVYWRSAPPRKHRDQRTCSGKESVCLPGKGGKCVACCDDE